MPADHSKALVVADGSHTQHNPEVQDGPQASVGYVHWLRRQFPDLTDWDVIQEIPDKSANGNTMV
jgi:predicted SnoaL-like aldol condensation-catalyzing enzyme